MAELQIDDDWKRQAQEEKRRLAEQQAAKSAAVPAANEPTQSASRSRESLEASFDGLVSLLATQAFFYLGEMPGSDGEPSIDLDMARYHIDALTILEAKSAGNLTGDEQKSLDVTLYELRMRYVSIVAQVVR